LFSSANKVKKQLLCLTRKIIGVDEKIIMKKAFDLFLAFDDVISHGYRESVTMSQIESFLEMDSTDEKMHK
jgi:hypothetical protein